MSDAWNQTLDDGKFRVRVIQPDDGDGYAGTLIVTVEETGEVILEEPVGILYAARFGPDIADVSVWQEKTITAVDAWLAAQGT